MVLTDWQITYHQILVQRGALRLEVAGMRHSSGRSVYAYVKQTYGFKGSKQRVLEQMNVMIEWLKEGIAQ